MTIRVLGALDIGQGTLGPRERTLLAALVARRSASLAPAQLAEACWGEDPPATWQQQVRNSVARIRRVLGPESIETVGTEYRLGLDPAAIDAVQFERLVEAARTHGLRGDDGRAVDAYTRALGLWRGTPLPEIAEWDAGIGEARRLTEIRASAEEELLEARLRLGEHRTLIPEAERLVRDAPLREDRWAILALATYRADRQAEALATVRAARERLADELGIEPGARLQSLETAMLRQDPSLEAPHVERTASSECPYPGLRAYGTDEAELFFGRERDADAVVERLRRGRILALAGPSGTGKSSLAFAGVIPRLSESGIACEVVSPGRDVAATLRAAAAKAGALIVDQAEELLGMDDGERARFGEAARVFVGDGGMLLITARSDALDALRTLPGIGDAIGEHIHLLGPLTPAGAREAVEQPARRAGLRLEPGLTELALRDLGDRASTLPHFSHAMRETWIRREGDTLTVAGYEDSGGIAGAIAQSAEEVYRSLPEDEQTVCRSVMTRLIDRGEDGSSTRRRVTAAPFLADTDRRRVIERLARARLLTVDGTSVMVTHEAVARAWPRLDRWLDEDRDRMRVLRGVESAAAAWEADGEDDDDLLRGAHLTAALELRQASPRDLTPRELAFLDASDARQRAELDDLRHRAHRERARNRTLRLALGGVATLLVAVLIAGGVAVIRGEEARAAGESARIEALTASSLALRSSDRDLAALLAVEAYRRWPDDDRVRSALLGIMMAADGLIRRIEHPHPAVVAAEPASDGALVVTDGEAGVTMRSIDLRDDAVRRTFDVAVPGPSPHPRFLAVSPDGRSAAVQTPLWASEDEPGLCCHNHFTFIDLVSGRQLASVRVPARTSFPVVFSTDGTRVFVGNPVTFDVQSVDIRTGEMAASDPGVFDDHMGAQSRADSVAVVGDGSVVVGSPGALIAYEESDLRERARITTDGDLSSASIAAIGDGTVLASGQDGAARIDVETGRTLWRAASVPGRPCWKVAVLPDRDTAYCSRLGTVAEWDLQTGEPTGREFATLVDEACEVIPRSDGDGLLLHAPSAGATFVWALDGSGAARTLVARGRQLVGGISGDGATVITKPLAGGPFSLWDIEKDAATGREAEWLSWVSPTVVENWSEQSGSTFLTTDGSSIRLDQEIVERMGEDIFPVPARPGPHAFVFAPQSDLFVAFDPMTGDRAGPFIEVPDIEGEMVHNRVSQSPDASRVALTYFDSGPRTTHTAVFDGRTGALVARGLAGTEGNVITHSGDLIAVTDTAVTRYGLDTLDPIASLPKPFSSGNTVEISDDERTMLIVGWDNRAALYGMRGRVKLADTIDAPSDELAQGAHLSHDGRLLVAGAAEGVIVWDLDPAVHAAAACEIAGRELTEVEWRTHFDDTRTTATCP